MAELYYGRGEDSYNEKLIAFLNDVFFRDDENATDFIDLLPKVYKDEYRPSYNNFVVRESGGDFRAAIGNFYNDMLVGGEKLRTCCIGNVAVGREYRSKGYMIELMDMSVEDMKSNGTAFAYLGGQRQRYGYFGFENAGTVYDFTFSRASYRHSLKNIRGGFRIEKLDKNDREAIDVIDSIYSRGAVISLRPKDAYFDILCSWRDIPYILKDGDKIVGYAVFSGNMKHICEFGLADNAYLSRFIASLFENGDNDSYSITVAPFETEKLDFFAVNGSGVTINQCESVLIFDFKKVIGAFLRAKASYSKLCDGVFTVLIHSKTGDERLKISVKNNEVAVDRHEGDVECELTCHEAVRAFFSNYPNNRAAFSPEVQQWLPLPMFIFSRDSM